MPVVFGRVTMALRDMLVYGLMGFVFVVGGVLEMGFKKFSEI
jgi:hypothetical protein